MPPRRSTSRRSGYGSFSPARWRSGRAILFRVSGDRTCLDSAWPSSPSRCRSSRSGYCRKPQSVFFPSPGRRSILAVPSHGWLLTNRISQFIGLISYSFYLWHWPVWLAARHFEHARTALDVAGLFVVTLLLALASRLAIERTFHRRPAGRPTWRGIVMASAVCAVVAVAGVVVGQSGLPKRVPPLVADVLGAALTEESIRQDRCSPVSTGWRREARRRMLRSGQPVTGSGGPALR